MLRVITLIDQKNHYLEKFYSLNEEELANFARGDFANLDYFYETREQMLETIKYIDEEIDKINVDTAKLTADEKKQIALAFQVKDQYVSRILAQDLQVLACIENAKSNIIKELQEIKKTKKVVGSYKTRTFNYRIDEEA